jgi:hypothetical protein
MHPKTSELLDKVRTTLYERGNHYGSARTNHERISELWTGYLGDYVSPMQVSMCMLLVKVSRLQESENHIDSIEDIIGYAAIYHTLLSELEDEFDSPESK